MSIFLDYPSNTNVEVSLYVSTSTFMQYDQIHHKDIMTSELNLNKPIIHARQEQTNFMPGDSTVHAGGIVPEVDLDKPVEYIPHNYISYDHYCPNCQSYY
ncbi:32817_t:CDS:2 [Gigaspora margarita]|uniref:32817_t:CDS:1 n=1 Tax=Gigaspora margarita TaxID=4874 RepID=A0ABN7V2P6_GIGMA|nr:32817_t:CDS:2 [Gigaspora margarita]